MKLYYFNPNNWGAQYFVMAENKIKAHEYLLTFLEKRMNKSEEQCYLKTNQNELKEWEIVDPLDPTTFPQKYKLDEYEVGEVINSENS